MGRPPAKERDPDFARRLRQGTDANASGAVRIAGSIHFKEKYAPDFPLVHSAPGLVTNRAQLEALGVVAAPEEVDLRATVITVRRGGGTPHDVPRAPTRTAKGWYVQCTGEGSPMERKATPPFDLKAFLAKADGGKTITKCQAGRIVYSQGDPANSIFYIQKGKIKLTVVSTQGKEAVVAILGGGSFFGEGCLAGQQLRVATAIATSECTIVRLEEAATIRLLHEPAFSELFLSYLLSRNIRIEEDLIDQLFDSSEKRLARVLLLLASYGKEGKPEPAIAKISQKTLAELIGTTRSRVKFFMNRFRKLGFIEYNGGLHIHNSLLNILLHD